MKLNEIRHLRNELKLSKFSIDWKKMTFMLIDEWINERIICNKVMKKLSKIKNTKNELKELKKSYKEICNEYHKKLHDMDLYKSIAMKYLFELEEGQYIINRSYGVRYSKQNNRIIKEISNGYDLRTGEITSWKVDCIYSDKFNV